jgi:carbon storage regulator
MLVLSRKRGERIAIGDDVWLTVISINPKSGAVRLGIDAPGHIRIQREEVLAAIDEHLADGRQGP